MPNVTGSIRCLLLGLTLSALGCHAQSGPSQKDGAASGGQGGTASTSSSLSPELARRVEVLLRQKSNVPPDYQVHVGTRSKSEIPGFDKVTVTFSSDGQSSKPLPFLLSTDGKTLGQFSTYDISKDPKQLVSAADRPARGGPASAPVVIVGFDDLECPYCAKMHAQLFPALLERYKDQVRVVYRDFPLDQHPWAMRAAIDANCVASQSPAGYWKVVDYIHLHAAELGGEEKSLVKANDALDTLARDEGKREKVNDGVLDACIKKQDDSAVKASMKEATALGVDSTPALFINGEKLEGAYPLEVVYRMIDNALTAAGQTPPPPVAAPARAANASGKPGN